MEKGLGPLFNKDQGKVLGRKTVTGAGGVGGGKGASPDTGFKRHNGADFGENLKGKEVNLKKKHNLKRRAIKKREKRKGAFKAQYGETRLRETR